MSDQRLLDYIQQQLQKGVAKDAIKAELVSNGWSDEEVEQAISEATVSPPIITPPSSSAPQTPPLVEESEKAVKVSPSQPQITSNGKLKGALMIFSDAYGLYKKRLKTVLAISFIPASIQFLLGFALTTILAPRVQAWASSFYAGTQDINSSLTSLIPIGTALAIALLLVIVLQIWGLVALICAIKNENEPLGVWEAYHQAWPKIIRYYWTLILAGLVTLGTFVLFLAPGALVFIFQIPVLSKIMLYGGFALLLIPGIIISIWTSFAGFVAIAEKEKGIAATAKSREYIKGNWWETVWRYIVGGALMLDIGFALLLGFFLVAWLAPYRLP
jgi:hypothetical protein